MILYNSRWVLRKILLLTISGFFILSCKQDQGGEISIPPVFQKYVDSFIEEGAKRGYNIDFSDTGLSIIFRDAVDKESGGVCKGRHDIEIEKFYWDNLNENQREGLIFHELGHCELNRPHRNDTLINGEWASRMRGDPIPEGRTVVVNYTGTRRDYYIDELFDETTPFPEWASRTANYEDYEESDKEVIKEIAEEVAEFSENYNLSSSDDYELETEIMRGDSESWLGVQWAGEENDFGIFIAFDGARRFVIESGKEVWGPMRDIERLTDLRTQLFYNKLTIRKIGQLYYVFVNEKFIYWFDFKLPRNNIFKSLVAGPTPPAFRNTRISKLLK